MATIKSYTDLEQSKKLAKILPLESADMYYLAKPDDTNSNMVASNICIPRRSENDGQAFGEACAWSLAALLNVMPNENMLVKTTDGEYYCLAKDVMTKHYDNPLDACYYMVMRLNELKML